MENKKLASELYYAKELLEKYMNTSDKCKKDCIYYVADALGRISVVGHMLDENEDSARWQKGGNNV